MNYTKTVLMPIKVPDCDYCWEPCAPHRICGHFDNEGGHPTCDINLGTVKYEDDGGVRKPAECACLANPTGQPRRRQGDKMKSERKTKDEPQAGRRRLDRVVRVFIANIRANVWCLFHFGHCIFTCKTKARGHWPQTDSIEVGTGSIFNGTWKTVKVFYPNPSIHRTGGEQ